MMRYENHGTTVVIAAIFAFTIEGTDGRPADENTKFFLHQT